MIRRLTLVLGVLAALGLGGLLLVRMIEGDATRFEVTGDTLRIEGAITGASAERFERLLAQNPGLELVVLGDIAGTDDVSWLLQMGLLLRGARLATRAEGELINDAILLLTAGERRSIADTARLRLASEAAARDAGWPLEISDAATAERRRFAAGMLGSTDWFEFASETRATRDIYDLSTAEVVFFGLAFPDP